MNLKIGSPCGTPDGPGLVLTKEPFGNGDSDLRLGVRHYSYPVNRVKGMYLEDILYYFPQEVTGSKGLDRC